MRKYLFLLPVFVWSCNRPPEPKEYTLPESITVHGDTTKLNAMNSGFEMDKNDTLPVGDVNGDGKKDHAILANHEPKSAADSQYVTISFDCNVPSFQHANGFHGLMADAGDLDGNGTDELLYFPDWYQSMWAGLFVYGYRKGSWQLLGSADIRRDLVGEAPDPVRYLQSRIKKVDNHNFLLKDHHINPEGGDITDSTITVKIP